MKRGEKHMKNMYYSYLNTEDKQLFKTYCVLKNISSFKMQNYFSGNLPIPQDFKEWLMKRGENHRVYKAFRGSKNKS